MGFKYTQKQNSNEKNRKDSNWSARDHNKEGWTHNKQVKSIKPLKGFQTEKNSAAILSDLSTKYCGRKRSLNNKFNLLKKAEYRRLRERWQKPLSTEYVLYVHDA